MAKPSDLPNWATDAAYPAGVEPEATDPNKVEPDATKQGIGWRPDEKPPADELNWWMNLVYLWIAYLNTNSIDGDLEVDGDIRANNVLLNAGGSILSDDGVVQLDGGMSTPVVYWTTPITRLHSPAEWFVDATHTHAAIEVIVAASANVINMGLRVDVGDVVTGFRVRMKKNTNGSNSVNVRIMAVTDGVEVAATSDTSSTANAPGLINLDGTDDVPIVAGKSYNMQFESDGSVTPSADHLYHVELFVTHPPP